MVRRIALWAAIMVLATLVAAAPALGYNTTAYPKPGCNGDSCHFEQVNGDLNPDGPHGTFSSNTNGCGICHWIHDSPGSYKLTYGESLTGACESCHDATGGPGVYGILEARGVSVASGHSLDATNVVPGGDYNTGGSATYTFGGQNAMLSCGDCHSAHGQNVVNDFYGERARVWGLERRVTDSGRNLKQRPNNIGYDITEYGSDWCLACHRGRSSQGPVHNHPVETTAVADYYYYDNVSIVQTAGTSLTTTGTLGYLGFEIDPIGGNGVRGNYGYVMPYPRSSDQQGHLPLCMQCHEDQRNVGDEVFGQISTKPRNDPDHERFKSLPMGDLPGDGTFANPQFTNFPHEHAGPTLLLETGDDLCTNCHPPAGLP